MTRAYEDTELIPASDEFAPPDDGEAADNVRWLRGVDAADGDAAPDGDKETVVLIEGNGAAKSTPDNVRWLRSRLGAGPTSWAFRRGPHTVSVAGVDEDGYAPPPGSSDDNGPATIAPLRGRALSTRLSDHYLFVIERKGKGGKTFVTEEWFPASDCDRVLDLADFLPYLRPLRGVTHTPMVRADGSVLDRAGYDDSSGFLYLPDVDVSPVPEQPTAGQLDAAVTMLRAIVAEFAWAGDHDEANFLGMLLTPLLRELCPPPYKLGAIMARQPGSGKSLLNQILRDVHGGVFRGEMPHDDAELEKSISSILTCTTAPVVQFDNVSGTLRSSRLAALLTSREYSGRVLGSTNSVEMVNDRLWTLTGNNLNLGGDLVRRTLWVTIDPGCPDPQLRTGFKLDIPAYVAEHRGSILWSLLVLVRAWYAAGAVRDVRSSDSYAVWSSTVRGILAHAGVPGEFDHAESAQQSVGADDEGWGEFLAVVREAMGGRPWTVRDLVEQLSAKDGFTPSEGAQELADALPGDLHEKFLRGGASAVSRSLGMWLRNRNGRWAGALVCELAGSDAHAKSKLWAVRTLDGHSARQGAAS